MILTVSYTALLTSQTTVSYKSGVDVGNRGTEVSRCKKSVGRSALVNIQKHEGGKRTM